MLFIHINRFAFALGLADRVAGVTEFCNYPAGVETKTRVGDPELHLQVQVRLQLQALQEKGEAVKSPAPD